MKRLLYTLAAAFIASAGHSRTIVISLIPAVQPNVLDSSTLPLSAGSLPSLAPAANASWDFGSVPVQPRPHVFSHGAATPGFPLATFADSATFIVLDSFGIGYRAWRNVQQSSAGAAVAGDEIMIRQAVSLGPVTGDALDSISFPLQAAAYSKASPIVRLPFTLDSSWTSLTSRSMTYYLTIAAQRLMNAPVQHRQIRRTLDSVVGWGRMRVPVPDKGPSGWVEVLQVHHTGIVLDSFFLSSGPVPAAVLAKLGLVQGKSTTTCHTYFYRSGSLQPLAEAVHSGPSFSSAPAAFSMHAANLHAPLAVNPPVNLRDIRVYPNPVRDGKLHIDAPVGEDWRYSICNLAGQLVAKAGPANTIVALPAGLQPGIYVITFTNAAGMNVAQPVMIE